MSVLRTAVVVALFALGVSACGSGHHLGFTTFSQVGGLSVPTPPGFHRRSWGGGLTISDEAIGLGSSSAPLSAGYLPEDLSRVAFNVYLLDKGPPNLRTSRFPLTFAKLSPATRQPNGVLRGRAFVFAHQIYGVQVWLGRNAPAADRSAVLSALHAVKPR